MKCETDSILCRHQHPTPPPPFSPTRVRVVHFNRQKTSVIIVFAVQPARIVYRRRSFLTLFVRQCVRPVQLFVGRIPRSIRLTYHLLLLLPRVVFVFVSRR